MRCKITAFSSPGKIFSLLLRSKSGKRIKDDAKTKEKALRSGVVGVRLRITCRRLPHRDGEPQLVPHRLRGADAVGAGALCGRCTWRRPLPTLVFFGRDEFVALTVDVDDFYLRVVLEVLSQFCDIHVHGARVEVVVVYPDGLQ